MGLVNTLILYKNSRVWESGSGISPWIRCGFFWVALLAVRYWRFEPALLTLDFLPLLLALTWDEC